MTFGMSVSYPIYWDWRLKIEMKIRNQPNLLDHGETVLNGEM